MENNKVTIVIPFFNRIDLLRRAVESVKAQTYKNWELILVDDCGAEQINFPVDEYRVLRNLKNSGPGFSRQAGLSISSGEFIAFLDSDDYYAPEFLEKSLEIHLSCDRQISFTYCCSGIANEPNEIWNNTDKSTSTIFPQLIFGRQWPTAALLWNRTYLQDWNAFSTWEDYDVEFRSSLLNNKIAHVKEKLVFITRDNVDGLSTRSQSASSLKDQMEVLNFLWCNKKHYDKLLDSSWNSQMVWTQLTIRTLKNLNYHLKINVSVERRNEKNSLMKIEGIEFLSLFKFTLIFFKLPTPVKILWLKAWVYFYKVRLERMQIVSVPYSNLNFE